MFWYCVGISVHDWYRTGIKVLALEHCPVYLTKNPDRGFAAVRFLFMRSFMWFFVCRFVLGTILSSIFWATRNTVEPTRSSFGPLLWRASSFSTVATRRFLGRSSWSSSSASSSLEESVRNSAGSRLGAFCVLLR